MARTKQITAVAGIVLTDADANALGLPAMAEATNALSTAQAAYSDERDLVNQLLGQAQMADAFGKFSQTVWSSKLAFVKENKLYKALAGKATPNGLGFLHGTWEEFCGLLGISDEKANQDIANLHAFGEEALESMSRMGIGYRELREFRKLPADQKAALIEVAKTGDKESFVELAEEIIAKHAKEKETLTQRAEESEATLEARSRVLEDKDQHINQLTEKLTKLQKRVKAMSPADVGAQIRTEATQAASVAEVNIRALNAAFSALAGHTDEHGIAHDDFMAGLLCQLEVAIGQLRSEFNVKTAPDGDEVPEWMRDGAEEEVNARVKETMAAAGWTLDTDGRMVPPGDTHTVN